MASPTQHLPVITDRVFEMAFRLVVGIEGGYSNDPRDPGGETKYGISKRAHPELDIAKLTLEQAQDVYRREYWQGAKCEALPPALAIEVFDCAVNQGVGTAARLLQKAVGAAVDGAIGPRTLAAIAGMEQMEATALFLAERALRYVETDGFQVFGRGWMKRLFKVQATVWRG